MACWRGEAAADRKRRFERGCWRRWERHGLVRGERTEPLHLRRRRAFIGSRNGRTSFSTSDLACFRLRWLGGGGLELLFKRSQYSVPQENSQARKSRVVRSQGSEGCQAATSHSIGTADPERWIILNLQTLPYQRQMDHTPI